MCRRERRPHHIQTPWEDWEVGVTPWQTKTQIKILINNQKRKTMAMNFRVREAQQVVNATSLGTVADIIGENGKISFIPANLANTDKRVYLVLEHENGTVDQVVCSKQVSEGLRSKEISLGHIMGFEIKEQTSATGEVYNQITMPSANQGLITFNAKDIKVVKYEVAELTEEKINSLLAVSL